MHSVAGNQVELGNRATPRRHSSVSQNSHGSSNGEDFSAITASPWNHVTRIVDGERGFRCIASLVGRDGRIFCLLLAGGLLYAGSESKSIGVWSHPDLVEYLIQSCGGGVKALAASENGEMVFSAHQDQRIRVWRRSQSNPALHSRLATLPTLKDCVYNFMRATPRKHADVITCLAYNAVDGLLYSSSEDKTVKVWRTSDFKCVDTIQCGGEAVNAVVVGRDGLVFTGSEDGAVKVWMRGVTGIRTHGDAQGRHLLVAITGGVKYKSAVMALAISPDGLIVYAGSCDGSINYWEKTQFLGRLHHAGILRGHRLAVTCVATAEDLVLSGSADRTIRVWKREPGTVHRCLAVLQGHRGSVRSIAASVDSRNGCIIYSGGLDGMVKVWWSPTTARALCFSSVA